MLRRGLTSTPFIVCVLREGGREGREGREGEREGGKEGGVNSVFFRKYSQ